MLFSVVIRFYKYGKQWGWFRTSPGVGTLRRLEREVVSIIATGTAQVNLIGHCKESYGLAVAAFSSVQRRATRPVLNKMI